MGARVRHAAARGEAGAQRGVTGVKICRTLEGRGSRARRAGHPFAVQPAERRHRDPELFGGAGIHRRFGVVRRPPPGGQPVGSAPRPHAPRLDKMLVLNHADPRYAPLLDYAAAVLDALDVRFGPTHLELFDTADGPTIVELNARLHGSLDPRLTSAVSGENHVSAAVEAVLHPELFGDVAAPTDFRGYCGHVLLLSSRNGVLRQDFTWQAIQALPSFVGQAMGQGGRHAARDDRPADARHRRPIARRSSGCWRIAGGFARSRLNSSRMNGRLRRRSAIGAARAARAARRGAPASARAAPACRPSTARNVSARAAQALPRT